jgi:hypothetical protein
MKIRAVLQIIVSCNYGSIGWLVGWLAGWLAGWLGLAFIVLQYCIAVFKCVFIPV